MAASTMGEPPGVDGVPGPAPISSRVSSGCSIASARYSYPQSQVDNLSFVVEMKGETVLGLHGKA
jgi:hypothetical protein